MERQIEGCADDNAGGMRRQAVLAAPCAEIADRRLVDAVQLSGAALVQFSQPASGGHYRIGLRGKFEIQTPVVRMRNRRWWTQTMCRRILHGDAPVQAHDEIAID